MRPVTRFDTFELQNREVLVCGGGSAALGPIGELLEAGARLTVIGPELSPTVADLAARGLLQAETREVTPSDLDRAALVVPATGNHRSDAELRELARRHGVVATRASGHPTQGSDQQSGSVILVGAGPGHPGLLTVAGQQAIQQADVIISDRLVPLGALDQARPDAMIIDVGKIPRGVATPQQTINALLVEHAEAGRTVVRLKGGDNFVFGRGGEEWQACAEAGIPVTVLPGVSSAIAAPALAGVPLTHRDLTQGFTVVSGHVPPDDPGCTLDWSALAAANTTLVIMMGVATLPKITSKLITEGLDPQTPAMTVANAGLPSQFSVHAPLADIAARSHAEGIRPPAITVIGAVAGFSPFPPASAGTAPGRRSAEPPTS